MNKLSCEEKLIVYQYRLKLEYKAKIEYYKELINKLEEEKETIDNINIKDINQIQKNILRSKNNYYYYKNKLKEL